MKNKISPPQAVFYHPVSNWCWNFSAPPFADERHGTRWLDGDNCRVFFIQIINTIFLYIIYKYPETSFFQALIDVFGKWIGPCLGRTLYIILCLGLHRSPFYIHKDSWHMGAPAHTKLGD